MLKKFIEYPKMKTLFKLIPSDVNGKKWDATSGEILPETAALHYLPLEAFVFTEKIDGTNMGIRIENGVVTNTQKRNHICSKETNDDKFYFELSDKIAETIDFKNIDQLQNVIIYGELCGERIQKGGNYFKGRRFIIFDILNTDTNKFFTWDAVKYFTNELNLETVQELVYDKHTLNVADVKDYIQNLKSAYNPEFDAEGFVIRYKSDTSFEKRWMAKIRKKDFKY